MQGARGELGSGGIHNGNLRDVLTRREAIVGMVAFPAAALAGSKGNRKMIYPPRLKPGDLVAIISPAGATESEASLAQAIVNVESLGLRVRRMPNLGQQWGYLGGTDEQRASDLNEAIRDREVKGIICLRGGYGTMRILPRLDYKALTKDPKVILGYSDITGLLNAFARKSGVVTFHGPIAEAKFLGFEGENLRRAIMEGEELNLFPNPTSLAGDPVYPPLRTIQSGKARGRLIGGNLSLIEPCAGTPYGPDFKDAILFLEDVAEAPYRVDRMLTSLWLRGELQKLNGIVFGDFRLPRDEPIDPGPDSFSMDQVFDNLRTWVKCPIFCGLHAGHIRDKLTLPIGGLAEIDADARTLQFVG